jgi:hypothetical protein
MPTDTTEQFFNVIESNILRAEFMDVDRRAIANMKDHDLALWQSKYPESSPQYIIAEHEWQRRLTVEQVNASRFAAFMGLLGAVVGAFITWLASK